MPLESGVSLQESRAMLDLWCKYSTILSVSQVLRLISNIFSHIYHKIF